MSQLPGVATAILDDCKITQYLLDPNHPVGGGKAKFFGSFGFSQANWMDLKKALLDHPRTNSVTNFAPTQYGGQKYVVSCSLTTPDGRNPCVVSVWIIEPPDPNPRFVTAYGGP
jgi:hypothetical protein